MADWQGMSHGSWHLHGHIHSCGGAYNNFNCRQGLLRYDVGVDASGYAPVSLGSSRRGLRRSTSRRVALNGRGGSTPRATSRSSAISKPIRGK